MGIDFRVIRAHLQGRLELIRLRAKITLLRRLHLITVQLSEDAPQANTLAAEWEAHEQVRGENGNRFTGRRYLRTLA